MTEEADSHWKVWTIPVCLLTFIVQGRAARSSVTVLRPYYVVYVYQLHRIPEHSVLVAHNLSVNTMTITIGTCNAITSCSAHCVRSARRCACGVSVDTALLAIAAPSPRWAIYYQVCVEDLVICYKKANGRIQTLQKHRIQNNSNVHVTRQRS